MLLATESSFQTLVSFIYNIDIFLMCRLPTIPQCERENTVQVFAELQQSLRILWFLSYTGTSRVFSVAQRFSWLHKVKEL